MLPRYLIGRAAAAPDDPKGGPIFILDRATPRLLIRFDPDVSHGDGAAVLRQLDAGEPVTVGDALMLRVWSPDGTPTFEAVADRLKHAVALYRDEVAPGVNATALPARWGCLIQGGLAHLLAGVPEARLGGPALVFDSAFRERPFTWSGVVLPGPDSLQFLQAADPDAPDTTFQLDACWPDRPITPVDVVFAQRAADAAWSEHNAGPK